MVFGDDGPAVAKLLDLSLAGIDHGLNGEGHARLNDFQCAGSAVVQNLGLFVELFADAVPTKLSHNGVALAFGKALDGMSNVAQMHPRFDHHDAVPHGLMGDLAQALGRNGAFATNEHATGVAMPTVFDHGDVDIDDVTFFKLFVIGNAVADLVIDRGAN